MFEDKLLLAKNSMERLDYERSLSLLESAELVVEDNEHLEHLDDALRLGEVLDYLDFAYFVNGITYLYFRLRNRVSTETFVPPKKVEYENLQHLLLLF